MQRRNKCKTLFYGTRELQNKCHKRTLCYVPKFYIFALVIITAIMIVVINLCHQSKDNNLVVHRHVRFLTDLKYILVWKSYDDDDHPSSGQDPFIKQKCPHINCYITHNKSLLEANLRNFDAIVFNIKNIRKVKANKLKFARSNRQKYIFQSFEVAERYPACSYLLDDYFNLTWTYRLDSDIPQPFINIFDEKNKLVGPKKEMKWLNNLLRNKRVKKKIADKTKAVAWIVPKCSILANNEKFINELGDELKGYNYSLDLFGKCAPSKCPDNQVWKCYKMLEKVYYFHLVLEDFVAKDFVSDYIVNTLTHNTIPIVYGTNYSDFLPPGSYIDAKEHNMKNLGAIIDYLIRNQEKYSYFFDWKNHYYYTVRPKSHICDLCSALNDKDMMLKKSSYKNFRTWWNPDYDISCKPWVLTRNSSLL